MIARRLYNLGYRWFRMPWEIGPRQELVALFESGRLRPGRAVDLGCGTGANAIYLAQHGFDVTGVDFAPAALIKARRAASAVGVRARFVEDDFTNLRRLVGPFDFLLDYGSLDDLGPTGRARYVENVVPLAAPGSQFLLWCFEWSPRRWERFFGVRTMAPGEVERRFGRWFEIERVAVGEPGNLRMLIPRYAAYLMTRRTA